MFYKRFLGMSDKSKPNLGFCARVFTFRKGFAGMLFGIKMFFLKPKFLAEHLIFKKVHGRI